MAGVGHVDAQAVPGDLLVDCGAVVDSAEVGMGERVAADIEERVRGKIGQLAEADELQLPAALEPVSGEVPSLVAPQSHDARANEEDRRHAALAQERSHLRVPGGIPVVERERQLGSSPKGSMEPVLEGQDLVFHQEPVQVLAAFSSAELSKGCAGSPGTV